MMVSIRAEKMGFDRVQNLDGTEMNVLVSLGLMLWCTVRVPAGGLTD